MYAHAEASHAIASAAAGERGSYARHSALWLEGAREQARDLVSRIDVERLLERVTGLMASIRAPHRLVRAG